MILRFFTLLSLLFFYSNVNCQWNFGVKSGFRLAKLEYQIIPSNQRWRTNSIKTFEAGIVGEKSLSKNFISRSELNYVQKGGKTTEDFGNILITKNNEIELSTLLNSQIFIQKIGLYFGMGGFVGYSLKANVFNETYGRLLEIDFKEEDTYYSRVDLGFLVGGGLRYKLDKGALFLESRNRYSLTNFAYFDVDEDVFIGIKNLGFSLSLGYVFEFGKK